jgi:cell division protein FtsQ
MSRAGTTTRDRTGGHRTSERRPSTPVTPLARRRRPSRPRSRRRRWLRLAGAVLLLGAALWFLWAGPVLAVGTVQVDGADTLSAEEVREAAGIDVGIPLLRVDVEEVEARVARLPQIASVEVTRGWPRSVVVTVVERVPVAVVGEAGRRSLVDADGVLFDTITGAAPPGVVPLDVAAPGPGDPATMAALEALVALPDEVRDEVDGAAVTGPEDLTLTLTDGTLVRWGGPAESATKASVLTALLDRVADGDLEPAGVIDLSTPDAVVLR